MSACHARLCTPACATPVCGTVGPLLVAGRLLALMVALLFGVSLVGAATWVPGHRRDRRGAWALQRASRWVLRAIGVRLTVYGALRSGPSLVVGNHVSWLDVLALSASARMQMVAKAEVRRWPVIGRASVRAGTLFLQRERLRELPDAVAGMADALRSGSRVQVFPEGTTRCGTALNPFRRAAFQAALDAGVVVSPVTLRYLDEGDRQSAAPAFLGDETLIASVRRVVGLSRVTVRVHWLPAIPAIAGTGRNYIDRAVVARLAENAVARDLRIPVVRNRQLAPGTAVREVVAPEAVTSVASRPFLPAPVAVRGAA